MTMHSDEASQEPQNDALEQHIQAVQMEMYINIAEFLKGPGMAQVLRNLLAYAADHTVEEAYELYRKRQKKGWDPDAQELRWDEDQEYPYLN